ncbi:MAG: VanW family protein [Roseburia sp.]
MKKIKWILPVVCLAAVAVAVPTVTTIAKADENSNVIPDNIYIGDIAVGGMTAEEATAEVEAYVADSVNAEFELKADANSVTATTADLGVKWGNTDVVEEALNYTRTGNLLDRYKAKKDLEVSEKVFDIEYTVDEEDAEAFLNANSDDLNQEAIDNGLVREDGKFRIIEGQPGVEIDKEASLEVLKTFFADGWDGEDATIALAVEVVDPIGTTEELEKVQDLLGSYSTDFHTSAAGRAANVKNATSKINGTVLFPGEEFSVYDTISPMTADNGYELAGSYENGTTVETYGGGVCQVSTTLYNAVIRAELEITERYAHSMLVSYVKPSMDAAIAGELKNLKFKNNLDAPVYIEGYCENGIVYFNVYGEETRPSNREVSFESEVTSQEEATVEFVATADPIGTITKTQSAHIGTSAVLWKIVKEDGEVVSKEKFNSSKYKASPLIYSVGTASSNPAATAAMNEAIATQDEATVRAAAAAWNDEALAAAAAAPGPSPTEPTVEMSQSPGDIGATDSGSTDAGTTEGTDGGGV